MDQLAAPTVERTIQQIRVVLRDAGLSAAALDGVLLVGGASRMPLVATVLHRRLGIAAVSVERPELLVAEGSTLVPVADHAARTARAAQIPLTSMLAAQAAQARSALVAGLDSPRYTSLLNDLDDFVTAAATGRIKRRDLLHRAGKVLRRADDQLDNAANDEQRHESRKAFKRARYATELVEPLAGRRATRLADGLTELQDVLGSHQDAIVTGELLRKMAEAAHQAGENGFTFGLLHARADEHGRRALDDLPKVRRNARRAGRAMYH